MTAAQDGDGVRTKFFYKLYTIPGEALEGRDCWSGLLPEQNKASDGQRITNRELR